MATLQRIRNHSVALLVIVGFAMIAFIVGDLITSSSSIIQSQRDKVVVINGEKVTYEEYEAERQQKQDFIKAMQGQELDAQATQQLNNQVYSEIVAKHLLDETLAKLGLTVNKAELSELIQGQQPSQVLTQMFGQQAPQIISYFLTVAQNDAFDQMAQSNPFFSEGNWNEIKNQVLLNRKSEKLNGIIAAAVTPNKLEAKDNFNGDNEECTFAYVKQYVGAVADSAVTVKKDDVVKYYESTKRNYKLASERRNVSYISVALRPSDLDYAEAEADIKAVRDEFAQTEDIADLVNGNSNVPYIDAFVAVSAMDEETRQFVEQNEVGAILEPHREAGDVYMMARLIDKTVAPDSTELAVVFVQDKNEADSISKVLASSNDATVALASYNSQQKFVGWMQDPALLQSFGDELRNKIRATAKGSMFNHEINGMSIVGKVTDKTKPVALAKVAIYANEVIPSTRTRGEEYGKLNRFLTNYKSVKQMQDSARAEGFMMMPTTLYATAYSVGGIQDARQAVKFAFQNKKGDVSEIYEVAGNNLLVVAITGDIEDGYISLADTTFYKQLSQFNVAPLKKAEVLTKKFEEVQDKTLAGYAAAFNGASIDTARFVNFNLNSVMGLGAEPKIFQAALNAKEGEVITVAGKNTVVALQVINKNNKGLNYDEQARLEAVARTRDYTQAVSSAMQVLQNKADIEDNRINFY